MAIQKLRHGVLPPPELLELLAGHQINLLSSLVKEITPSCSTQLISGTPCHMMVTSLMEGYSVRPVCGKEVDQRGCWSWWLTGTFLFRGSFSLNTRHSREDQFLHALLVNYLESLWPSVDTGYWAR